ncbi:DUF5333 domain-containing protein [Shimia litoralis]|nr:DUF5333 domain-containing protein [Shimia litoralis]
MIARYCITQASGLSAQGGARASAPVTKTDRRETMRAIIPVTLCAVLAAGPVFAKTGLSQEKSINDGLFALAVANEIRDYCPTISARLFKAYSFMRALKRSANELGYADNEIEAYIENDDEKAKMRARGEAYLKQNGVSYDDPQSFCTLGRAEIQKTSQIGALLRAK